MTIPPLQTGQRTCHATTGQTIPCPDSGQDASFSNGVRWPEPRFVLQDSPVVQDRLTGLYWLQNANPAEFPLTWPEALDFIRQLNQQQEAGCNDWRLPNRRELRSLMSYQTRKPALPENHPFTNLFIGWYWTSTTAVISPAHAWYVHMEGARMFYGGKDQSYLVWPVRGAGNGSLAATGQQHCYAADGAIIPCADSGQDSELRLGAAWPQPRFLAQDQEVTDCLTGLVWRKNASLTPAECTWEQALQGIRELQAQEPDKGWRLPNINELESLIDCSQHTPALPAAHPFTHLLDGYWSSTTSMFEPDWAWVLYLDKGATGVGYKPGKTFHVWAVR
jgi:hypothetical protein